MLLVVDDDLGILRLLESFLKDEGYRVMTASNGAEALKRVQEERPKLILLDLGMPIMDGPSFVAALRSGGDHNIPIVLMTAATDGRRHARELRTNGCLNKPLDLDRLLGCIQSIVAAA